MHSLRPRFLGVPPLLRSHRADAHDPLGENRDYGGLYTYVESRMEQH